MTNIPESIGIILDGNRRFAKEHGLSPLEGHERGGEKVREILEWAHEAGVKEVVLYAFSTENWKRSEEEVQHLMRLFERICDQWGGDIQKRGGRVKFIGEKSALPASLVAKMSTLEAGTASGTEGVVWIALSYGGRAEILAGVNALLAQRISSVDEETFSHALWSAGMKDPDLIIRTGGDHRLSNFLTWQSVYSELYFTDTKLPALTKEEFVSILEAYGNRERRLGA